MKRIYHTGPNITSRNRAVLSGGSFCFPCLMEMRMTRTRMEKTGKRIQPLTDRELQGKVGKRFFSDGKAGPFGFRGKIILAALRYFSRKPCLSGSVYRKALVVQRAAKARVFTLKNKEYATSDHHKTVTSSDRDARDKKTESTRPATGNQAATKGNHRSRSHLKAAEPRSGNLQTSGQEQAAGRILQRILKHIV